MFLGSFKNTIFVLRSETSQTFPCFIINSQFLVLILTWLFSSLSWSISLGLMRVESFFYPCTPLTRCLVDTSRIIRSFYIWRFDDVRLFIRCIFAWRSCVQWHRCYYTFFYHKVHKELIMVTVYIVWSTNQLLPEVILIHTSHLNYDRSITWLN